MTRQSAAWWEEMNIAGMKITTEALMDQLVQAEKAGDDDMVSELQKKLILHPQLTVTQWNHLAEAILQRGTRATSDVIILLARDPNADPLSLAKKNDIILDEYAQEELQRRKIMFDKIHELDSASAEPAVHVHLAKSHWAKIADIIVGTDSDGQNQVGRALRTDFWPEALVGGAVMPNTRLCGEEMLQDSAYIWVNSHSRLPLFKWLEQVGLTEEKVLYLSSSQQELFKCQVTDGQLRDSDDIALHGGCRREIEFVMTLDKKLYALHDSALNKVHAQIQRDAIIKFSESFPGEIPAPLISKLNNEQISVDEFMEQLNQCVEDEKFQFIWKAIEKSLSENELVEHHTTLTSGKPVLCAGMFEFSDGDISVISLKSGHYQPTEKNLIQFLKALEEQGLTLKGVALKNWDEGWITTWPEDAQQWLQKKTAHAGLRGGLFREGATSDSTPPSALGKHGQNSSGSKEPKIS